MASKKDIINNELMKEIITIRTDTAWRMLLMEKEGLMPREEDEGATGYFDNKGATFIPGGIVFEDSDKNPVPKKTYRNPDSKKFRKIVRDSMQTDNAILLYPDGFASGINLDNGFFAEASSTIIANRQAAYKRKPVLKSNNPILKINSDHITRSHSPSYVQPPYGSRTKLSSCISICLIEPRMYYIHCRSEYNPRGDAEEKNIWNSIISAQKPIPGKDKTVLAPPYIVVCHTTRYKKEIYTGITRILGIGKFGEFANFTLERATGELLNEIKREEKKYHPRDIFAEYDGKIIVGVLRIYSETKPGRRLKKVTAQLISPEKDLGIDVEAIKRESMKRYRIK